jgi:hypothetical protein
MNNIGVFILPGFEWLARRQLGTNIMFFNDLNIMQSNCSKKVIFDFVIENKSHEYQTLLSKRIAKHRQIFDKIVILNSDYVGGEQSNILEECQKSDFTNVEIITTGTINYQPRSMKITRYENFFGTLIDLYQRLNYYPINDLYPFKEKPLYFDALLGLERPSRDWVLNEINKFDPTKFFTKYYRKYNISLNDIKNDFLMPEGAVIKEHNQNNFFSGMRVDYGGIETSLSHVIPIDIYNNTAYSIVTETTGSNNFSFYTEKTAKTIFSKRLAVYFAGMHHLKNLHSLGFKTFDVIIDESYDNEPDQIKRFTKAFDQIKYLCNQNQADILSQIKPIVDYNYDLFVSRDWKKDFNDCLISAILN